jgi:phage terminase large subunit GpA-like protein
MDRELLEQLTAEELVTFLEGGRPKREWRKTRERNEFLDLTVYAFCMLHALGVGVVNSLGDAAKDHLATAAARKAKETATPPTDPDAVPASPKDETPAESDRATNGLREARAGRWMRSR